MTIYHYHYSFLHTIMQATNSTWHSMCIVK